MNPSGQEPLFRLLRDLDFVLSLEDPDLISLGQAKHGTGDVSVAEDVRGSNAIGGSLFY